MCYLEVGGNLQERGVGYHCALDDVVKCKVKSVTTLQASSDGGRNSTVEEHTAEAIASCAKLGDTFSFECGYDLIEGWASLVGAVLGEPSHEIKRGRLSEHGIRACDAE
jgi:hypothetical protein